jgi:hypothetical protein
MSEVQGALSAVSRGLVLGFHIHPSIHPSIHRWVVRGSRLSGPVLPGVYPVGATLNRWVMEEAALLSAGRGAAQVASALTAAKLRTRDGGGGSYGLESGGSLPARGGCKRLKR